MRREDKRRKLHEALLNTLYPPSPPPPQSKTLQDKNGDEELESASKESFDVDLIPDDYGILIEKNKEGSLSSTSEDEEETPGGTQKLSRAQRKRVRRRKLKEDAFRRGKIIGPLLPPMGRDCLDHGGCSPGVRGNAGDSLNLEGEPSVGSDNNLKKKKKIKQRRMAKRVGMEESNMTSPFGNCPEENKPGKQDSCVNSKSCS